MNGLLMDGACRLLISLHAAPLAALLLVFACAQARAQDAIAAEAAGPTPETEQAAPAEYRCDQPGSDGQAMVDKIQRGVYLGVCGTARWFDGLFGTRRFDQDSDQTFGRLGLYELWEDRDGFDTRARLRARIALPTAEQRLKLLVGRVDDREIVENSNPSGSLPSSFARVDDEVWLLGLGYSRQEAFRNGFDFGAGVRVRTPVDPYVNGTYRHNIAFTDATALRARQTIFWRDSRGYGETTEIDLDYLLTPRLLLRWDNSATLAEDVERLEWYSAGIAFQSLSTRRAISYTAFVRGVVNTDVPLRDYGVEVRFRRQAYREWLFLDLRSSLTWPRESLEEDRDINPGVGIGFEMYFGPVPEERLR
jgi:hypothetical protein